MLTNEQRAHDIALVSIPIVYQVDVMSAQNSQTDKTVNFDVFKRYLELYSKALNAVNRNFPDLNKE